MGSLGQLIVEITTDLTRLNKDMKAAKDLVNETSGEISKITNKIGVTMTAMGAAITGAFALMVKSTTEYSEEIYRTSERTGVAVETLSALRYVADQTEASFQAVAMGLRFLNRNIYEATNGNYKMNEAFRTLGITLQDEVTGRVLKADQVFMKIADRFSQVQDGSAKTALAMQIFGRQGEGLIPILDLGSAKIQELSDQAKKLGIVLTADNAKSLDRFGDSIRTMQSSLSGLWMNITLLVMPTIERFVNKVTEIVIQIRKWSEEHPKLASALANWSLTIGALMLVLGPMVLMFNQLAQAWLYLNLILPELTANVTAFRVALGLVNTATLGLISAYAGWKLGEWIEKNSDKIKKFWNDMDAKLHTWKPKGPVMEFDIGKGLDEYFPSGKEKEPVDLGKIKVTKSVEELGELSSTVSLLERHAQKLKELNDLYLTGQINAKEYYEAIQQLHQDGLDIKQQELEQLNASIELERLATDQEYQRIFVMGEGIRSAQEYAQVKAELANQDLVNQRTSLNAATELLQTLQSMHVTIWSGIFGFINTGIKTFSAGFSSAISSIILGTKTASEAFKDLGMQMITAVVEFVIQWAVQALIAMTLGKLLTAWVMAQADALAAAWLPAAVFASIATLGGADAAGAAGMALAAGAGISLLGAMQGLAPAAGVTAMAEGGSGVVTKPTLFLAGEAGPERYDFTPLGRSGAGDIRINMENVIVASEGLSIGELSEQLANDIKAKLKR